MEKKFYRKAYELSKLYTPEINLEEKGNTPANGIFKSITDMLDDTYSKMGDVDLIYENKLSGLLKNKRGIMLGASGLVEIIPMDSLEGSRYIKKGTTIYTDINGESMAFYINKGGNISDTKGEDIIFSDTKNGFLYGCKYGENKCIGKYKEYLKKQVIQVAISNNQVVKPGNKNIYLEFNQGEKDTIFRGLNEGRVEVSLIGEGEKLKANYIIDKNKMVITVPEKMLFNVDEINFEFGNGFNGEIIKSDEVFIGSSGTDDTPILMKNDTEIKVENKDFIFGERYNVYDFFYIGSSDVLSNGGSTARIEMDLSYLEIPYSEEFILDVNYKMVMREKDFGSRRISKILLERVIWEYYNGKAWKRLFFNNDYEECFKRQSKNVIFDFDIPDDIVELEVNGIKNHFIRGRVDKVSSFFNVDSLFISPRVEKISLKHKYEKMKEVTYRLRDNLFDWVDYGKQLSYKSIGYLSSANSIYVFLTGPIDPGKISMYFKIESNQLNKSAISISTVYSGESNFRELDIEDMTNNFNHNGCIELNVDRTMGKKEVFGRSGYWLKIDNTNYVANELILCDMKFNIFPVIQEEEVNDLFYKAYEIGEDGLLDLAMENITGIQLWVNEKGLLNSREVKELKKSGQIDEEVEFIDSKDHVWVRWDRVKDIFDSSNSKRLYTLDFSNSLIKFSSRIARITANNQIDSVVKIAVKNSSGAAGNTGDLKSFSSRVLLSGVKEINSITPLLNGRNTDTYYQFLEKNLAILSHKQALVTNRDYEKFILTNLDGIEDVKAVGTGKGVLLTIYSTYHNMDSFNEEEIRINLRKLLLGKEDLLIADTEIRFPEILYIRVNADIEVNKKHVKLIESKSLEEDLNKYIFKEKSKSKIIGNIKTYEELYRFFYNMIYINNVEKLIVDYFTVSNGIEKKVSIVNESDIDRYIPAVGRHNIRLKMGD